MTWMFYNAGLFNQDLGWCLGLDVSSTDAFQSTACSISSCGVTFSGSCPTPTVLPTLSPTAPPSKKPTALPTEAPSKRSEHPCSNEWGKKWKQMSRKCKRARNKACRKKKKSQKCKIFMEKLL
jgi:hypothetical protein